MRRILLASTMLALLAAPIQPAHAILGVGDIVFDPANHAEAIAQLRQMEESFRVAQDTYNTVNRVYEAANTRTGLAGLVARFFIPMPDGGSLSGLLNGTGGGGILGSLLGEFLGEDYRRYDPPGEDFQASETRRQRQALAGHLSAQRAIYDEIQRRQAALGEIEAASRTATTQSEKDDVNRAFSAEVAGIQALQVQVANITAMTRSQRENDELRVREERALNLDEMRESLMQARAARLGG